ncbi:hypothetical protein HK100_001992 [Physocladia obscura]|uniref:Uncharacterized protein n=1 Tax=Physocladia obscura TaxID=109957 RepID=A0AAD5SW05_9FUNG|nr:hypothetical protein HK100_001992 [Physocladia obscura]
MSNSELLSRIETLEGYLNLAQKLIKSLEQTNEKNAAEIDALKAKNAKLRVKQQQRSISEDTPPSGTTKDTFPTHSPISPAAVLINSYTPASSAASSLKTTNNNNKRKAWQRDSSVDSVDSSSDGRLSPSQNPALIPAAAVFPTAVSSSHSIERAQSWMTVIRSKYPWFNSNRSMYSRAFRVTQEFIDTNHLGNIRQTSGRPTFLIPSNLYTAYWNHLEVTGITAALTTYFAVNGNGKGGSDRNGVISSFAGKKSRSGVVAADGEDSESDINLTMPSSKAANVSVLTNTSTTTRSSITVNGGGFSSSASTIANQSHNPSTTQPPVTNIWYMVIRTRYPDFSSTTSKYKSILSKTLIFLRDHGCTVDKIVAVPPHLHTEYLNTFEGLGLFKGLKKVEKRSSSPRLPPPPKPAVVTAAVDSGSKNSAYPGIEHMKIINATMPSYSAIPIESKKAIMVGVYSFLEEEMPAEKLLKCTIHDLSSGEDSYNIPFEYVSAFSEWIHAELSRCFPDVKCRRFFLEDEK